MLIGANGSGKSTLLRTLAGLQAAVGGVVEICGRPVGSYGRRALARVRAIVDTARHGGGGLTVEEAVAVGMPDFARRSLAELSDGERQKVMIARALAQQTPLLILDEPTAFLDVAARLEIMKMLRSLADAGRAVILSTHDIAPAMAQADMVLAVDAAARTAVLGARDGMIAGGVLDRTFAGAGLHFDPAVMDFR